MQGARDGAERVRDIVEDLRRLSAEGSGEATNLDLVETARLSANRIAVGTCATCGGMTSAGENPADAVGVQYDGAHPGGALAVDFRSRSGLPVINVAGCPTYPDWVTETLLLLVDGALGADARDSLSKAATPRRIGVNATADRIAVPPSTGKPKP